MEFIIVVFIWEPKTSFFIHMATKEVEKFIGEGISSTFKIQGDGKSIVD